LDAQILNASSKEVNLSIKESDIGTLYIVQHELLKEKGIDFAGIIMKHPLTNEIWMRVNSTKGNPIKEITDATDEATKSVNELKKLFNSKIKVN
jgi:DNA-directed RNA polymerase subunit L